MPKNQTLDSLLISANVQSDQKKFQIPFGDLKRHYAAIRSEIDGALNRVLTSGWFVLGQELVRFEKMFAKYLGSRQAVGVGSGTEALHLALVACGCQPGDEVITVPNTAVPTISAISFANLKPVFVDIQPDTFLIDVSKIEREITERTKVLLPVHLYGQACNMREVLRIAQKHGLKVVEDAAQAHGAEFKGRRVGTFGDYGCFSFYPSKNLGAFGDGGMVVTNSDDGAKKIRLLRNYGQTERYYHRTIGFNSRLDEMQAALLSAQLPLLDQWNNRRREIAHFYDENIRNDLIKLPADGTHVRHVYHLYVVRCPKRDKLRTFLQDHGIGTQIHYPIPCHQQEAYKDLGYASGSFPVAEQAANEVVSLPIYPELTDDEVAYITRTLNAFA